MREGHVQAHLNAQKWQSLMKKMTRCRTELQMLVPHPHIIGAQTHAESSKIRRRLKLAGGSR
jgi:hypothetical protein